MISIQYRNGENKIYNEAGCQADGSFTRGQQGLNPRELLEASLGLCASITLTKLLQRDNIPVDTAEIDVEVTASKDGSGANQFSQFDVKITLPDNLDEAYKKKALTIIERGCTISNTLKASSTVNLSQWIK